MAAFQEEPNMSVQQFYYEYSFSKPVKILGQKGSDFRQMKIERKNFKLSHKVMAGFVCTFCAM